MSTLGSLTDEHVLELSERITGETELMDLGIKVLGLPDFIIKTALYNTFSLPPMMIYPRGYNNKTTDEKLTSAFMLACEGLR